MPASAICRTCCGRATPWCSTTRGSSRPACAAGASARTEPWCGSRRCCTCARRRTGGGPSRGRPSACGSATGSRSARPRTAPATSAGSTPPSRSGGRGARRCSPSTSPGRSSTRRWRGSGNCRCRPTSRPSAPPTRRTRPITRRFTPASRGGRGPDRRAALHPGLLARLDAAGLSRHRVTLHVGAGTFLPVKADDTDDHRMHAEFGAVTPETADALNAVRAAGGRIVAVGTTSLRLLGERGRSGRHDPALRRRDPPVRHPGTPLPGGGRADDQLPPAALDAVHAGLRLRRSRPMRRAYAEAVARGYRFYSYGDSSLLFRADTP